MLDRDDDGFVLWYVPDDDGTVAAAIRALEARHRAALAARTGQRDPHTLCLDLDEMRRRRAERDK